MTDKDEKGFTRNAKTYFNTAYTADPKKMISLPMFHKFHWCLLLLTQEECRNRQRLTFEIGGSFCSSVTHLHYRLFTRHCFLKIPSAPWNERNAIPKAEINTWELVEHKYLLCVASKGRADECQWQRKFICQRNEQVAIWNSEYEPGVWLTFVGRIVWCVLPLSKFRQWIKDQKAKKWDAAAAHIFRHQMHLIFVLDYHALH